MTLTVAALPALFGAAGCFDAPTVDQGPWVIDDFEDGDLNPFDRNFGSWGCYTWPQPIQYLPVLDAGDQSTYALALDFTIASPASGTVDSVGAGVQTGTAKTPEDLSRFRQMIFSHKFVPGVPALPGTTNFTVHLGCSTVPLDDGTNPGNVEVIQPFDVTTDWREGGPLPMANFVSPLYLTTHIRGGPAACLQHVDSIHFEIEPLLPAGQSTMGRLDIDEINFQ